jgi:hypothetical protein
MPDFKPFCLADNMARSAIGLDFRFPSRNAAAGAKKPGREAATGLPKDHEDLFPQEPPDDQFAATTSDSNGL